MKKDLPEEKAGPEETAGPGADLDSTEGADAFQTEKEAEEIDDAQRDDLIDEDIISLDGSD